MSKSSKSPGKGAAKTEAACHFGNSWSSGPSDTPSNPVLSEEDRAKLNSYAGKDWGLYRANIEKPTSRVAATKKKDSKYVGYDDGKLYITTRGVLSNMTLVPPRSGGYPSVVGGVWKESKVGSGPSARSMMFMDIAVAVEGGDTTITQFRSVGVVLTGRTPAQMSKVVGKDERQMGVHFARIGLPMAHFHPIIWGAVPMTAQQSDVSVGEDYAYLQASWGIKDNPCRFMYKAGDEMKTITDQRKVHAMMKGKSCMGLATVGISIGGNSKVCDGRKSVNENETKFSVKIYEFVMQSSGIWCSGEVASTAPLKGTDEELAALGVDMMSLEDMGTSSGNHRTDIFDDEDDDDDDGGADGNGGGMVFENIE
jgi:hypothetical protein